MYIKSRLNIFESGLVILTMLSFIGLGFYFHDLLSEPTGRNPFEIYNTNPGIIRISIGSVISRTVFIALFLILLTDKYRKSAIIKSTYLISALVIGFLQWYELYYGSTFYYGEVRDKQGLMFPLLACFMVTLVIWKINYSPERSRNITIKIVLTGLINIGLYFLWTRVYEPWNLWQS